MDISGIFGKKDDSAGSSISDESNIDNKSEESQIVSFADPLEVMDDDLENKDEFLPNETMSTNDHSAVGEFKPAERPQPVRPVSEMIGFAVPSAAAKIAEEAKSANLEDSAKSVAKISGDFANAAEEQSEDNKENSAEISTHDILSELEPEDPEKLDFIKTYTQEFDEMLRRATDTAQKILDSIDMAVHDHSPDITIPNEAKEFIDNAPEDGKVQKFEDARTIVRTVMQKANEAKQQSEVAAAEAAQVYDDVQNFKRDTKEQIKALRGEENSSSESLANK